MTERSEIIEMMATLQLAGMRAAYDEIVTTGVKRQHSVERIIGALLKAEIAAKNARSINYQLGIAKLPLVKELADLRLDDTTINGALLESLGAGAFLDSQRNVVLIGDTGTGKSHIAIGIARNVIRAGRKARFFNAVDLGNKLESEVKGRHACRRDPQRLDPQRLDLPQLRDTVSGTMALPNAHPSTPAIGLCHRQQIEHASRSDVPRRRCRSIFFYASCDGRRRSAQDFPQHSLPAAPPTEDFAPMPADLPTSPSPCFQSRARLRA